MIPEGYIIYGEKVKVRRTSKGLSKRGGRKYLVCVKDQGRKGELLAVRWVSTRPTLKPSQVLVIFNTTFAVDWDKIEEPSQV